jgi:hypothetical protein
MGINSSVSEMVEQLIALGYPMTLTGGDIARIMGTSPQTALAVMHSSGLAPIGKGTGKRWWLPDVAKAIRNYGGNAPKAGRPAKERVV